jgi:hypothetical protein
MDLLIATRFNLKQYCSNVEGFIEGLPMHRIRKLFFYYLDYLTRRVMDAAHDRNDRDYRREQPQIELSEKLAGFQQVLRGMTPDNPAVSGFKVYSQADEDGILANILNRLPEIGRTNSFIEIGCGDGRENNSHYLLLQGYRGVWLDGSSDHIASITAALGDEARWGRRLKLMARFVTRENIGDILHEATDFIGTPEPDLFSLDIDGNDAFVMAEAIKSIRPRVVCLEYNAKFPPPARVSTRYDPAAVWEEDDYQGASLTYFCDVMQGYMLVACSISGCNAFFVRGDLAGGFTNYPVASLYQPFRGYFRFLRSQHPLSMKWLRDSLNAG